MKKNISSLIIFVFLFAGCAIFQSEVKAQKVEKATAEANIEQGKAILEEASEARLKLAPDFKLKDLYGNEYILSSYKDKQPVVLFFFTTWCPYCRKELSDLNNRYPELSRNGFELFAINVGESEEKVVNFAKNYSLAFKILLDKDTSVAQTYGILGVPSYILVNKKGRIIASRNYFPEKEYNQLISK